MLNSVTRHVGGTGEPDRALRSPALAALTRLIETAGASAGSASAFGPPVRSGETTVIPVARVSLLASMGGGSSRVPRGDGAGGLGLARVRPSGYIVLDGSGTSFRPIRQPAAMLAIPLAAIAAVAATRIVGVSVREARRRRKVAARQAAATAAVTAAAPAHAAGCAAEAVTEPAT
ncbi:hypothetical protein [Nocardiopsis sp. NRRL B-16309]|uniref:hypothetical protein n=1 Tax=Nocardiopsis sp. NRRL B-16309 TaxID=1519494 RepID=UPI0006B04868|nr:hypothetical protein [Nocardiopsis sp. NRRL B-16309]KOX11229.1 hypothetical protein ADL05_23555 [Nocardiopsis sp. NRRL B-16309]